MPEETPEAARSSRIYEQFAASSKNSPGKYGRKAVDDGPEGVALARTNPAMLH